MASGQRGPWLPEAACYDVLLEMPKDGNLGAAVNAAMEAVEDNFQPLAGQLPKDYERFDDNVLEEMMRKFDSEALRTASDMFALTLWNELSIAGISILCEKQILILQKRLHYSTFGIFHGVL